MVERRGKFITFEGGEGCGKTTQIERLERALRQTGIAAERTREPGGTEGAEAIRALLLTGDPDRWDVLSETLLFYAARVQHVRARILPALEAGKMLLCDRFADSTRVYQGIKGVPRAQIEQLHALALGALEPDVTLLLDIDPDIGLRRAASRSGDETRFERMDRTFHQRVRQEFLALASAAPQRFAVIDASGSPDEVHQEILRVVSMRLGWPLLTQGVEA